MEVEDEEVTGGSEEGTGDEKGGVKDMYRRKRKKKFYCERWHLFLVSLVC